MARRYAHHDLRVGLEGIRISDELKERLFESGYSRILLFSKMSCLADKGFDGINVALVNCRYMVGGFCQTLHCFLPVENHAWMRRRILDGGHIDRLVRLYVGQVGHILVYF